MITIENCKEGRLYRIKARNIRMGVFSSKAYGKPGFAGIREKFGNRFLDIEYHYDADPHFGTATPLEEAGEYPNTFLDTHLPGMWCPKCEAGMGTHGEAGKREDFHLEDTDCPNKWGMLKQNKELFDWLNEREQEERILQLKKLEHDSVEIVYRFYEYMELRDEPARKLLETVKLIRDMQQSRREDKDE